MLFLLIGRIIPNLIEEIVESDSDNSYRKVTNKIKESTLKSISNQTVKNKVDYVGEAIGKLENERMYLPCKKGFSLIK